MARWDDHFRFDYDSTGDETYFRDTRDPKSRSRGAFAFHQPQTLQVWLTEALRSRFHSLPPLDTAGPRGVSPSPGRVSAVRTGVPSRERRHFRASTLKVRPRFAKGDKQR